MNQGITIELHFFLISILWGVLVLLAYDQLRILRRIIRHNALFVAIQDLLFWVLSSVFIFAMIYTENSGTIRGFSVMGMVIGMIIYHYILSDLLVTLVSRMILLLMRPFSIAITYTLKCLKFLINKVKKLSNRIYSQLKSKTKSVKISLDKHKQIRKVNTNKKQEKKRTKKSIRKKAKEVTKKSKLRSHKQIIED